MVAIHTQHAVVRATGKVAEGIERGLELGEIPRGDASSVF
jgi:hypothetical protein